MLPRKRSFQADELENNDSDPENTEERLATETLSVLKNDSETLIPLEEARQILGAALSKSARLNKEKRVDLRLSTAIARHEAFFKTALVGACAERDKLRNLNDQAKKLISKFKINT